MCMSETQQFDVHVTEETFDVHVPYITGIHCPYNSYNINSMCMLELQRILDLS